MNINDASFEHDDFQSDDVVCLDIDPQVLDDGTEVSINTNTIYMANIYDHDISLRHQDLVMNQLVAVAGGIQVASSFDIDLTQLGNQLVVSIMVKQEIQS